MEKPIIGEAGVHGDVYISAHAAQTLIGGKNPDAALLYIYISAKQGDFDRRSAINDLSITGERLDSAVAFLREEGLLRDDRVGVPSSPPERIPKAEEIAGVIKNDSDFAAVADEIGERLGRALTRADLEILLNIYENLSFSAGVLSLLVTRCMDEITRKFGPGRKPTMRQVEKEAYIWRDEGVYDVKSAENYLLRLDRLRGTINRVARAMQIKDRALSQSELSYVNSWIEMGFDADVIYMAYDRTVLNTGALKWSYMNSILASWHKKGLHTVSEIETGDAPARQKTDRPQPDRPRQTVRPPRLGDAAGTPGETERRALEWVKNYRPAEKNGK